LGFNVNGVDSRGLGHRAALGQGIKQPDPEQPAGPAVKPIRDRGRRTIFSRIIAPATPGLEHVKNTGNDPPIIDPPGSGLVLRKLRLDHRPLLITQPKQRDHHRFPRRCGKKMIICYAKSIQRLLEPQGLLAE
jgi:hypothetical protein